MTAEFDVYGYREDDAHTLVLSGELDLVCAPALVSIVSRLCADGARELLLDIGELRFLDSTGLRALLSARTICEEHMCEFKMTRGKTQVERLFEITRVFDDVLDRDESDISRGAAVRLWPEPAEGTRE